MLALPPGGCNFIGVSPVSGEYPRHKVEAPPGAWRHATARDEFGMLAVPRQSVDLPAIDNASPPAAFMLELSSKIFKACFEALLVGVSS
jgi:hypothetical protein